jgi:hypothetical protein
MGGWGWGLGWRLGPGSWGAGALGRWCAGAGPGGAGHWELAAGRELGRWQGAGALWAVWAAALGLRRLLGRRAGGCAGCPAAALTPAAPAPRPRAQAATAAPSAAWARSSASSSATAPTAPSCPPATPASTRCCCQSTPAQPRWPTCSSWPYSTARALGSSRRRGGGGGAQQAGAPPVWGAAPQLAAGSFIQRWGPGCGVGGGGLALHFMRALLGARAALQLAAAFRLGFVRGRAAPGSAAVQRSRPARCGGAAPLALVALVALAGGGGAAAGALPGLVRWVGG